MFYGMDEQMNGWTDGWPDGRGSCKKQEAEGCKAELTHNERKVTVVCMWWWGAVNQD